MQQVHKQTHFSNLLCNVYTNDKDFLQLKYNTPGVLLHHSDYIKFLAQYNNLPIPEGRDIKKIISCFFNKMEQYQSDDSNDIKNILLESIREINN